MLIVDSYDDNIYNILDTDDLTIESISKQELLYILQQGYFIFGTSEFALQNNIKVNLILRLYNKEGDVKDYDGILLRDVCPEYNEFMYQVIDSIDYKDDLLSNEVFNKILDIIKRTNNKRGCIKQDYPIGYSIFAKGDIDISIKDLETNDLYSADYFACLAIYLDEHKSVKGIKEITDNYMILDSGEYYSADNILQFYRYTNNKLKYTPTSDINYDELESTWGSLNNVFNSYDRLRVTNCRFPLYNIRNNIVRLSGSYSNFDYNMLSSTVISFDNKTLHFENGCSLSDSSLIAKYFNIIIFKSDDLKEIVYNYLQGLIAKEQMLKVNHNIKSNLELSHSRIDDIGDWLVKDYRINNVFRKPDVQILRTKFGIIYETHSMIIDDSCSFRTLFLVRITNLGTVYWDSDTHKICVGTGQDCNKGNCLCNDVFQSAYNKCVISGLCYCHDMIVPLCIARVKLEGDSIDIRVLCLIMADTESVLRYDFNLVEVPLLFLGSKLFEYDDCYVIKGMFTTITFDKNLVEHLLGYFNEENFLDLWTSIKSKKSKEAYEGLYKHSKSVLRQVLDN